MTPPKILIADSISHRGIDEMTRDGAFNVSIQTGLSEAELVGIIPEFSGIVVRSQTKITASIVNAGACLRVIGRADVAGGVAGRGRALAGRVRFHQPPYAAHAGDPSRARHRAADEDDRRRAREQLRAGRPGR